MSSTSGIGGQGKGSSGSNALMLQITQLLKSATTSLDAQVKRLKAEALQKDKALEASQQQVKALTLDLERVRKEYQDKIRQMRKELVEQDDKLEDLQRKLSARGGGNLGLLSSQQIYLEDVKVMVAPTEVPSRPSTGNVEPGASFSLMAGAGGQSEGTDESIENEGLLKPALQTNAQDGRADEPIKENTPRPQPGVLAQAKEKSMDDRTKRAVPGPSRQATPSVSTPCRIPRRGVRNVDEISAVRIKQEKDEQPEGILKHKKAPRSKALKDIGQYSCVCGRVFLKPNSLESHLKNYKKKDVRWKDKGTKCQKKVVCTLCCEYYPRRELYQHQKTEHHVDLTGEDDQNIDQQSASSSNMDKKRKKNSCPSTTKGSKKDRTE